VPTPENPYQAESDDHAYTEPLEDEDGNEYRIGQQAVGAERVIGGGEFPDRDTPARSPAPGSAESAPGDRDEPLDEPD
jgi:hypothetical protein